MGRRTKTSGKVIRPGEPTVYLEDSVHADLWRDTLLRLDAIEGEADPVEITTLNDVRQFVWSSGENGYYNWYAPTKESAPTALLPTTTSGGVATYIAPVTADSATVYFSANCIGADAEYDSGLIGVSLSKLSFTGTSVTRTVLESGLIILPSSGGDPGHQEISFTYTGSAIAAGDHLEVAVVLQLAGLTTDKVIDTAFTIKLQS